MCIISIKAKGIPMPTDETFATMFYNNDDGAGYMYAYRNKVYIKKGFMKLSDFKDSIKKLHETLGISDLTDIPMIFHFRIGTAGGNIPENTHPFPITDNVKIIKALNYKTDIGVAHNGIIHNVTPRTGISDTMEYILSQMSIMKKIDKKFYSKPLYLELMENAVESKLAFLDGKGKIYTVGRFVTDEATGLVYSNESYKARKSYFGLNSSYRYNNNSLFADRDKNYIGNALPYSYNTVQDDYGWDDYDWTDGYGKKHNSKNENGGLKLDVTLDKDIELSDDMPETEYYAGDNIVERYITPLEPDDDYIYLNNSKSYYIPEYDYQFGIDSNHKVYKLDSELGIAIPLSAVAMTYNDELGNKFADPKTKEFDMDNSILFEIMSKTKYEEYFMESYGMSLDDYYGDYNSIYELSDIDYEDYENYEADSEDYDIEEISSVTAETEIVNTTEKE